MKKEVSPNWHRLVCTDDHLYIIPVDKKTDWDEQIDNGRCPNYAQRIHRKENLRFDENWIIVDEDRYGWQGFIKEGS